MGLFSSLSKILTGRPDRYATMTLHNPNPFADIFGKSVAISGKHAIVGSCETNEIGTSGTAYVYDITSSTPTIPIITLNHPDPEELVYSDNFSWTVAVDGNIAMIGAEAEQGQYFISNDEYELQENSGKVHIFKIEGSSNNVTTISNPMKMIPSKDNFFGSRLALSGSRAVISTRRGPLVSADGANLVYVYDNKTGVLHQTLSSPHETGSNAYRRFGNSVDIHSNFVIVGAFDESDQTHELVGSPPLPQESGKAYVFDLKSGGSSLSYTLDNPNVYGLIDGDQFGFSVGIHDRTAVIGAPGEDSGISGEQTDTGVVYVYELLSKNITSEPIVVTAPKGSKRFGHTIDISDTYIVIGAPDVDVENEQDNGKIFVYERTNLDEPYAVINNPDPEGISMEDNFGCQLSLSGDCIIANSVQERIQDEDNYKIPGNVYIFKLKHDK